MVSDPGVDVVLLRGFYFISGDFVNYTDSDGPYPPRNLGGAGGPITVNFTWDNQTGKPRTIGWIIYANDTYINGLTNGKSPFDEHGIDHVLRQRMDDARPAAFGAICLTRDDNEILSTIAVGQLFCAAHGDDAVVRGRWGGRLATVARHEPRRGLERDRHSARDSRPRAEDEVAGEDRSRLLRAGRGSRPSLRHRPPTRS